MSDQNKATELTEETRQHLRETQARLLARFHELYASGQMPDQTLALRSHINHLDSVLSPGTRNLWPDYSAAEKSFLAEQEQRQQREGNRLSSFLIGSVAGGPGALAEAFGASPVVVRQMQEIGFNLAMVAEAGLLHGSQMPAEIKNIEHPAETAIRPNKEAASIAPLISVDPALEVSPLIRPLVEWTQVPHAGTLSNVIDFYAGVNRGRLLADVRAESAREKTVDQWLDYYRIEPEGRAAAKQHAQEFIDKMAKDIGRDDHLDPDAADKVRKGVQAGYYMRSRDYAALEISREIAHEQFVQDAVNSAMQGSQDIPQGTEHLWRMSLKNIFDAASPYGTGKFSFSESPSQDQHPPAPER